MTSEIITSERLVLRLVRDSDADTLHETIFSEPEVMAHAFAGKTFSRQESAYFIDNYFDHDGNGEQMGVLVLNAGGEIIGLAGLLACSALDHRDYEIGFVLARKHWGKGYATEIGLAQIEYGLEEKGCERLLALAAPGNTASKSVIRKIGMHYHSSIDTDMRGLRDIYVTQSHT